MPYPVHAKKPGTARCLPPAANGGAEPGVFSDDPPNCQVTTGGKLSFFLPVAVSSASIFLRVRFDAESRNRGQEGGGILIDQIGQVPPWNRGNLFNRQYLAQCGQSPRSLRPGPTIRLTAQALRFGSKPRGNGTHPVPEDTPSFHPLAIWLAAMAGRAIQISSRPTREAPSALSTADRGPIRVRVDHAPAPNLCLPANRGATHKPATRRALSRVSFAPSKKQGWSSSSSIQSRQFGNDIAADCPRPCPGSNGH